MLIAIAAGGLMLLSAIYGLLARYRLKFRFDWHLGITGGLLVWGLVLLGGFQMPAILPFLRWAPAALFPSTPALLIDEISWPLSLALVTLLLGILSTSPIRMKTVSHGAWAGNFGLAAAGLLALCAANPLSLVLAWSVIDIAELGILLQIVRAEPERRRLVSMLAFRSLGTGLYLIAVILNPVGTTFADFTHLSPFQNLLLLLAVSLRLGVLPFHVSFLHESPLRRGLGSSLRLVPAIASIVALARTTGGALPDFWVNTLLSLAILSALYGSVAWSLSGDDLEGRSDWVLGLSALAIAANLLDQPMAVAMLGVMMLLGGGILFLDALRNDKVLVVQFLVISLSLGLPYTTTWAVAGLFEENFPWLALLIFPAQAVLVVGQVMHARKPVNIEPSRENWRVLLGYVGLVFILLVYGMLGVWAWQNGNRFAVWPGFVVLALVFLSFWAYSRWKFGETERFLSWFRRVFSLRWAYALVARGYQQVASGVHFVNRILEGEGGILWSLLLLAILFALLGQVTR